MNIVLTGFMGTGKTAVGQRLAKRLGWPFVDIDRLIEQRAGMPISEIFTQRGEAVFRRLERRCISRVVHGQHQVIATGGGAIVDLQNRAKLRASGVVICLTAKPQAVLARVRHKLAARPMLSGAENPLARIRALMAQRAAAYAKADITIDSTGLSVEEELKRVWDAISPYLCRSSQYLRDHAQALGRRYGGRYIVVSGDRVVATGETQLEAFQRASARLSGAQEAGVYYIPSPEDAVAARA
jgi:shikimate kinase